MANVPNCEIKGSEFEHKEHYYAHSHFQINALEKKVWTSVTTNVLHSRLVL